MKDQAEHIDLAVGVTSEFRHVHQTIVSQGFTVVDELEESDEHNLDDRPDDLPDDVPSEATITIKEINDNRYYYFNGVREIKVKSKYKSPI